MKVSRVSEMRVMDQTAIETFGISAELLMENAGHAAYFALRNEFGVLNKRFLIFCGFGNNGGDSLVLKVAQSMDIVTYVSTRSKKISSERDARGYYGPRILPKRKCRQNSMPPSFSLPLETWWSPSSHS
jgi:NAD(P)H-hydrate repair Nnr-like enzyme with NAD(P)H-hydrate epimerase domain